MRKISIRNAYDDALKTLGGINKRVVVLDAAADGSSDNTLFGDVYPDRHFRAGISEINLVNMSAGMARAGLIPFIDISSLFPSSRSAYLIQSWIAHERLNVKLAGTYAGTDEAYGEDGHHSSDLAFVRSLPNITVIIPSDPTQARKAVFAAAGFRGPVYLRLSGAPAEEIYTEDIIFEIGKGTLVRAGKDLTIISSGAILGRVLDAAVLLEKEGISAEIIDMPTVKPLDEGILLESAKKTGAVLTVEEDSIHGGLYSAVTETLSRQAPTLADGTGVRELAESGNLNWLSDNLAFPAEEIARRAKKLIALKNDKR